MARGVIKIATCQFAVNSSLEHNADMIGSFMRQAGEAGADVVHFSECALSGYGGLDFQTLENYDWDLLRARTEEILALAGELKIWVILGSMHRLTPPNKPHNCLYLVSAKGKLLDRYDKRFCTEIDLQHYTPGNRFVNFEINGVMCSLLICFDLRFPEIYRQLKTHGVDCIFQSFYNARQKGPSVHSEIMRQTMQCRAATNYFWVSMTNSSAWLCPYPSCFIQPDGKIAAQIDDHRDAMTVNTLDLNKSYYDPSAKFRQSAINGILTNGPGDLDDPRSKNITDL